MKHLFKLISILLIIFSFYQTGFSLPINQFINSVSPPMNALSVNKSSDIIITFTQDMTPATIINANIKVFGYQTGLLSTTINYNAVSKTATINPVNNFKVGEIISITLTSGQKTLTNEEITPFVFSFRAQSLGGTGIFTKSSGIDNVQIAYIKSGDIDSDGQIDLVVNNKIYKNNGNAVFSYFTTLSISGTPELADFDNDGDLDILIANNNTVYFYQNNGSGVFIQTINFPGGVGSFGDLDGNGYLDISYFASLFDLSVLKNNNGAFIPATILHLNINCVYPANYKDRILVDDFNNDGNLDMIGINGATEGNSISLYTLCRNFHMLVNNGSGNFITQLVFLNTTPPSPPFILSAEDSKSFDMNNDGYVDIASPGLRLRNNGNGSFSNVGSFIGFRNSVIADFNGDGNIDLVSNLGAASLLTSLNDGLGNFTEFIGNNNDFSRYSASGDFDNDGDIDIAIKEPYFGKVEILLNGDNPLPAEYSSFTSVVNLNTVKLNWTTTSEENNSGFEIERSIVNGDWSKINFVEGAGNSNTPKNYYYDDKNLSSGKYKYRLKQIDFNGNYKYYELSNEVSIGIPGKFELLQNHPNPFNPSTKINYSIPADGIVNLKIYNVNGKEVQTMVNEFKNAGYYVTEFDGSKLASGVYFYRMEVFNTPPAPSQEGSFVQTRKMLLIK